MKKQKTLHFCISCHKRFLSASWAIYCPKCKRTIKPAWELLPKGKD